MKQKIDLSPLDKVFVDMRLSRNNEDMKIAYGWIFLNNTLNISIQIYKSFEKILKVKEKRLVKFIIKRID